MLVVELRTEISLRRPLILDGGMGTFFQSLRLKEADYRLPLSALKPRAENYDLLCLTRPDIVKAAHLEYLQAGADIITTNSFMSNRLTQTRFGSANYSGQIAYQASVIARSAADEFMKSPQFGKSGKGRIIVGGSVGPGYASLSKLQASDPAKAAAEFSILKDAYVAQIKALASGGADVILFETVYDYRNLEAGLEAITEVSNSIGFTLPIMISATVSPDGLQISGGEPLTALCSLIQPWDKHIISLGINCSWGSGNLHDPLLILRNLSPYATSCHPNAGLPDKEGRYPATPDSFAADIKRYIDAGLIDIAGGCCGTTPAHIRALRSLLF